jgi:hypothetical protein
MVPAAFIRKGGRGSWGNSLQECEMDLTISGTDPSAPNLSFLLLQCSVSNRRKRIFQWPRFMHCFLNNILNQLICLRRLDTTGVVRDMTPCRF